jgi:hypothetical protein
MGEAKIDKAGKVDVLLKCTKKESDYIANVTTITLKAASATTGAASSSSSSAPAAAGKAIKADADGAFKLVAEAATITGTAQVEDYEVKNIGYWTDEKDVITWPLEIKKAGSYKVEMEYSVNGENAGSELAIVAGSGKDLSIKLDSTEEWETYKTISVGSVTFDKAGNADLKVKCTKKAGEYIVNIRNIKLTPAAKK